MLEKYRPNMTQEALHAWAKAAQAKLDSLKDYSTHHNDWLNACQKAYHNANNKVDASYWAYQIETLNKLADT